MNKNVLWRKIANISLYMAISLLGAGLVFFTKETSKSAADGIMLCVNVLIPSLFPFFVISSLAVQTGLAHLAGRLFARPMQLLFNLPGQCAPAFILGLVGGYPVGARTAISLYEQGLCTKEQAQRLLSFCNNSGPGFILGVVGASLFASPALGMLLYCTHVLAAISVGIISRFFAGKNSNANPNICFNAIPLSRAFTSAVTSSFASILNICAFVIFFAVFIKLLLLTGIIPFIAGIISPQGAGTTAIQGLISGFFEVTTGINSLVFADFNISTKLVLSAFMLGWAGLSVHFQVLSLIGESGLSCTKYIIGKLAHGGISALYTLIFLQSFSSGISLTTSAFNKLPYTLAPSTTNTIFLSVALCLSFWLITSLLSIFFIKINHCKKSKKPL